MYQHQENRPQTAADHILAPLNAAQKEAVTFAGRHLLVFAGPGTGKTRVITHRIAYLTGVQGVDPETILAITFTNKAAQGLKERLSALLSDQTPGRPWTGTFHAFAHWVLRRHWQEAGLSKEFVIYDQEDQRTLMRELLAETDVGPSKAGVLLDIIQRLKDDLMDAKSYAIHTDVSSNPHRAQIAKIYAAYQTALRSRGAVDFGDLLLEVNTLFKAHPEAVQLYRDRFAFVFVDEYQDVNRAQYAFMKLLVGEEGSLTCVADDDQVIYEWRNANPRYTLDFDKEFKGAGQVVLTENYRSTPNVLIPAAKLIANNELRKSKVLSATRPAGADPETCSMDDEREEARVIAERVKRLLDNGMAPSEVAVFYRINAQSRNFELEMRALGVPYRLVGAVGFYARKEIKDILAIARLLVNPKDEISFWRALANYPAFSITKDAMSRVQALAQRERCGLWAALELIKNGSREVSRKAAGKIGRFLDVYGALSLLMEKKAPLAAILEAVANETGYLETLEEERSWNVWELIESAGEFQMQNPGVDLLGFLNQTSLLASVSADNNRGSKSNAVSLMTIHLAKGLEFEAVFVTGLEEGLFPFKISKTNPQEMEEERRLFYVAMTRAKDILCLSYAKRRLVFGSEAAGSASRFLFESGLLKGQWQSKPDVRRGSRVKHPLFGEGRIIAVAGAGDDTKVTVHFTSGSTRKFLASVAPLEML
ncbi:MAG: UvrD-helicase domain-containing protein [Elusimicrobia bacterium]|nr:UvrD-helicase domain-containing protein [Elusimicrobiota bacterium]